VPLHQTQEVWSLHVLSSGHMSSFLEDSTGLSYAFAHSSLCLASCLCASCHCLRAPGPDPGQDHVLGTEPCGNLGTCWSWCPCRDRDTRGIGSLLPVGPGQNPEIKTINRLTALCLLGVPQTKPMHLLGRDPIFIFTTVYRG
jgi:hypothetical protein